VDKILFKGVICLNFWVATLWRLFTSEILHPPSKVWRGYNCRDRTV